MAAGSSINVLDPKKLVNPLSNAASEYVTKILQPMYTWIGILPYQYTDTGRFPTASKPINLNDVSIDDTRYNMNEASRYEKGIELREKRDVGMVYERGFYNPYTVKELKHDPFTVINGIKASTERIIGKPTDTKLCNDVLAAANIFNYISDSPSENFNENPIYFIQSVINYFHAEDRQLNYEPDTFLLKPSLYVKFTTWVNLAKAGVYSYTGFGNSTNLIPNVRPAYGLGTYDYIAWDSKQGPLGKLWLGIPDLPSNSTLLRRFRNVDTNVTFAPDTNPLIAFAETREDAESARFLRTNVHSSIGISVDTPFSLLKGTITDVSEE